MHKNAYIALGSNQGDRELYLLRGIAETGRLEGCRVTAISPFYETSPVGDLQQPNFYNAVIEIETILEPMQLLDALLHIETEIFGRVRTTRWGARTMDLDLLLFDGLNMENERLILPHPRLHERRFVLQPLNDIAPEITHPLLGKTVSELLSVLDSNETVTRI